MLRQRDVAEPELFGQTQLLDLLVDASGILFRRRRQGQGEPPEAHAISPKKIGKRLMCRVKQVADSGCDREQRGVLADKAGDLQAEWQGVD